MRLSFDGAVHLQLLLRKRATIGSNGHQRSAKIDENLSCTSEHHLLYPSLPMITLNKIFIVPIRANLSLCIW
jgi:hypothetical protein